MSGEPKILLCRLFERTSANGNRYMFGRVGNAKVIAFVDRDAEPQYGAEVIWNVFLQAGDLDGQRQASRSTAPAAPRTRTAPRPRPATDDGSSGRPFDDPLDDIGMVP